MTYQKSVLLDTSALLAYFKEESSANEVAIYLSRIEQGSMLGYISCISITEIISIIGAKDPKAAYLILAYLEESPIRILSLGYSESKHAGDLKIKYRNLSLSTADTLIIASAVLNNVDIVLTGDRVWKKVEEVKVVEI